MKPYWESIVMPDGRLPVKGFINAASERAMMVHPHWHAEVEVLYYVDGAALQQVNDAIFMAVPGDIVVIGKDQLHSTYSAGLGCCRIMVLQFNAEVLLPQRGNGAGPGALFANETVFRNPIKASGAEGLLLLRELQEAYGELDRKEAGYEWMARAALFRFAGLLERLSLYTVRPRDPAGDKIARTMLEKTFRLVDEAFSEDITLDAAAAASSLSTTHFCRLFKRTTGMTFHEYLTFYRINRAERMLDPSRKLADIAFECGFGSVTSFIRNFRKYKNCAPSRYMQGASPEEGAGQTDRRP